MQKSLQCNSWDRERSLLWGGFVVFDYYYSRQSNASSPLNRTTSAQVSDVAYRPIELEYPYCSKNVLYIYQNIQINNISSSPVLEVPFCLCTS